MSLGFADVIFRRERSDDRKYVCGSQARSGQVEPQIVRRPLQSFIPCLFSLLVTVKLKPEIISQGDRELIVNMAPCGHNSLAIVQLILNRQPRQAFQERCYIIIFFRTADDSASKVLNGLQFSNILICGICPNIRTVVHSAED